MGTERAGGLCEGRLCSKGPDQSTRLKDDSAEKERQQRRTKPGGARGLNTFQGWRRDRLSLSAMPWPPRGQGHAGWCPPPVPSPSPQPMGWQNAPGSSAYGQLPCGGWGGGGGRLRMSPRIQDALFLKVTVSHTVPNPGRRVSTTHDSRQHPRHLVSPSTLQAAREAGVAVTLQSCGLVAQEPPRPPHFTVTCSTKGRDKSLQGTQSKPARGGGVGQEGAVCVLT